MHRALTYITSGFILYAFFWQFSVGSIPFAMGAFGVAMAICLGIRLLKGEPFVLGQCFPLLCVALFILLEGIVSVVVSKYPDISLSTVVKLCCYLLVCISFYCAGRQEKRNRDTLFFSVVLAVALTGFSIGTLGVFDEKTNQVVLGELNSNTFATLSMVGLFCAFILLSQSESRKKSFFLFVLVIAIINGVLLSASRRSFLVAILLVMAYVFVFVVPSSMKRNSRQTILILIVLVPLLCFVAIQLYGYLMTETGLGARLNNTGYEGDRQRVFFYKLALELFSQNPLFGVGLNQFQVINPYGVYSHSLYAESISCCGLFGSGLLVMLFAGLGKWVIAGKRGNSACQLSFASLLILLFSGLFCALIYDIAFYVLIACLLSASSGVIGDAGETKRRRR